MPKNLGGRPRKSRRPRNAITAWMRTSKTSAAALAETLGISASSVYALRDGRFTPGLDLAIRIEVVTGIPVTEWRSSTPKAKA